MKIGLIGLGTMGGAYAKHLLKCNLPCYGIEIEPKNQKKFINYGGLIVNYKELFENAELILTSIPSISAYNDVLLKIIKNGKNIHKRYIIDTNTIGINEKKDFKRKIKDLNIEMFDCPVSGTGAQAKDGDITIFASGKKNKLKKYMKILSLFSKNIFYVGRFGNGMKFKILANLLVAIHNTAAAEALRLGEIVGLDKKFIYEVLSNSAGSSVMLEKRMPLMINKKYLPATASFDIFLKDIKIIRDFINENNTHLPTFEASASVYDKAKTKLSQKWDTASVFEILKKMEK